MRWALTPFVVLVLAGCGGGDDKKAEGAPSEPSSRTLAATLEAGDGYDVLEGVITNAGLSAVLEGKGPYTVFAPTDAAFTAAANDSDFTSEALRAEAAALLRAHIVPGALTRSDITAAIERAGGEGVEMRTMADTLLTFTRDGEALVVTTPDGARARLGGEEQLASNGVLQPVDGLLVKAAAPAA
jgi:uncharacterized surface protein with fasciclin (FAS1) repeats